MIEYDSVLKAVHKANLVNRHACSVLVALTGESEKECIGRIHDAVLAGDVVYAAGDCGVQRVCFLTRAGKRKIKRLEKKQHNERTEQ